MPNSTETNDQLRSSVREQYGEVARRESGCCAPTFCGAGPDGSLKLGYDQSELDAVPEGANLGLGCGNPPFSPAKLYSTLAPVAALTAFLQRIK